MPDKQNTIEREAMMEVVRAARVLTSWCRPFVEKSPISAETLWREFPAALKKAQLALASLDKLNPPMGGDR